MITHGFEAYGLAAVSTTLNFFLVFYRDCFAKTGVLQMVANGTPADAAKKIIQDAVAVVHAGKEHWYNVL